MLAFNQFTGEDIASKEVDKFRNVIKQSLVDQYSKLFSLMKSRQIEPELLFVDQNNQPGLNSTRTDYVAIKGCEIQLKYGNKSADMERHSFLTKAPKIDDESLRSYRFYLPQFGFLSLETATKKAVKEWLKVQRLSRQVYNIAHDYEIDLKIILENDHAYAFVQGYTLTRFKDGAYALVCSETLQRRHLKGITKARMTFSGLGKPLINYNDKIDPGPYKTVLEKLYPGLEY